MVTWKVVSACKVYCSSPLKVRVSQFAEVSASSQVSFPLPPLIVSLPFPPLIVSLPSLTVHDKNRIQYRPNQLLVDNMIFHLRTFTTRLFEKAGGVGEFERCEDWDENLRMSEHTNVRCIPQVLYRYRIHESQISRTTRQNEEGAIAVRNAIKRRGLNLDLVVNDKGFHLRQRKTPPPLSLP